MKDRTVDRLTETWRQDHEYVAAYEALDHEFALAKAMILARTRARLSQTQLAEKMGTDQARISRWGSGAASPTVETPRRMADATGMELMARFKRPRRSKPAQPNRATV